MKNNELTEVKAAMPSLEGLPQEVIEYVHGLVAWTDAEELRGMEKDGCGYLFKVDPANPFTDPRRQIMLFDRPQKPVALPEGFHPDGDTDCGWVIDYAETVAAIEAAGGKVAE